MKANRLFQHKWSLLSGTVTALHILILYSVASFMFSRRAHLMDTAISVKLADFHIFAILVASAAAVAAIAKERPAVLGILLLVFALFSFLTYVG